MFDRSDVEAMRLPLERLCRQPDLRVNWPDINLPHKWHPYKVSHPVLLSHFTDDGAWEFIADCLQRGAPIRHKPPSVLLPDDAYEMIEAPPEGGRRIYMKIALRGDVKKLVGLSFHYGRY